MLLILRDFFPTRLWVDCSSVWFSRRKTYNLNHLILKQVNYSIWESPSEVTDLFCSFWQLLQAFHSASRGQPERRNHILLLTPQLSLISTVSVDQSYGFCRLGNQPLKLALALGVGGWRVKQREIFRVIELSWVGR